MLILGAFWGEKTNKLRKITVVIILCFLCSTLGVAIGYHIGRPIIQTTRNSFFVFDWTPTAQNITQGTLTITLNFTVENGHLKVIVIANDTDSVESSLVLAFDYNNDGSVVEYSPAEGHETRILFSNNYTNTCVVYADWSDKLLLPMMSPMPSTMHTCTYDSVKHTYIAEFDLPPNDTVQMRYGGKSSVIGISDAVVVKFRFGDLEA